MKSIYFLWFASLSVACCARKGSQTPPVQNLKVRALSSHTLQVTWDPPFLSAGTHLRSYSLVFLKVSARQRRINVELFVNQFNLTNLRPGTRYKLKLAAKVMKNKVIKRGMYSKWVNARTLGGDKFINEHSNLPRPPKGCSRIGEVCKNIGYEFSRLPNYFNQEYESDAELELSQFTPMVKSNCSSLLRIFLCSLYFPPCIHDTKRITPPCKSVCEKVKSDCGAWIRRSGLKWPFKFECNNFPRKRSGRCVELDYTFTHTEPKLPRRCERLEIDACKGFGYTYVQMPNLVHDQTQSEAKREMNKYSIVLATNCSAATLQFFLCLLHAPPCVINSTITIPPCREVCEEVRRGCEQYLAVFDTPWPQMLACSRFPWYDYEGKSVCLTQPGTKPTTAIKQPPAQPRCEPLRIPVCKSLNYSKTIMPNFLNHSSQAEAERALRNLQPHWNQCSKQMKRFLCFLLAPFCTSDGTPLPPCKPFCQKMKADCAHVSSLLTNLNCSKFSTLSAEHLCFGDPLTIIDCVGPHSRPCEVNSTTLPVVLRCSSRVKRFTFKIDEIKLSLRNQTNIFLSPSTSTAVQQCDQAQQQQQRQECQFDINYESLGIDSFMVYSVAIKYHCLD